MVFDLVDGWDNCGDWEEFLEISLAVVGNTNGLYFASGKKLLHF